MDAATAYEGVISDRDIYTRSQELALALHRRGVPPLFAFSLVKDDGQWGKILSDLRTIAGLIEAHFVNVDVDQDTSWDRHEWLYSAYFEAEGSSNFKERLAEELTQYLLSKFLPGIDEYVDQIDNLSIFSTVDLDSPRRYGMADVSQGSSLRLDRQALRIGADIALYPHQFLCSYYSSGFTSLLSILGDLSDEGFTVEIRVDPIRGWIPANQHLEFMQKAHWRGRLFDLAVLGDPRASYVTMHAEFKRRLNPFPVGYTVFRTNLMSAGLRQFSIEEFAPPAESGHKIPGAGDRFCIQRFGHFVYDQSAQTFEHVDAAVRIFNAEEYREVYALVSAGKEPISQIGRRAKLFYVSGGDLTLLHVQELMYAFFEHNSHLEEYFAPTIS